MRKLFTLVLILVLPIISNTSAYSLDKAYEVRIGSIIGQIGINKGGAMSGGKVFFFSEESGPPPSAIKYWRVPTHLFSLDEKGKFEAVLPAGRYYMGASRKLSGERLGPPNEGDLFFMSQDEKGDSKLHTVLPNEVLDLGLISGAEPFSRAKISMEGVTSIAGVIMDKKGSPSEGMMVFAFPTPMMFGRPLYVSERSDAEGRYILRLYEGGIFYLSARAGYGGGPPAADEVMGVYSEGEPVIVETGKTISGVDITVSTVGLPE